MFLRQFGPPQFCISIFGTLHFYGFPCIRLLPNTVTVVDVFLIPINMGNNNNNNNNNNDNNKELQIIMIIIEMLTR